MSSVDNNDIQSVQDEDNKTKLNLYERRLLISNEKPGGGGILILFRNANVFLLASFAALGGLLYGYNQGMFGQVLNMTSFKDTVKEASITNPVALGILTSILELGAWVGALINGYLADRLGRKMAIVASCICFIAGVIVQANAKGPSYILGGRFVTGMGVGGLSMVVPMYNAELSPPEARGALVALQQLAITFGIMISYWIGYGTNFIGGTGANQSKAAWLVPICIQILPALVLLFGFLFFMPQSPRWLIYAGRQEEALDVIAKLRRKPKDDDAVSVEFLEIKAQYLFDQEIKRENFPQYLDGSWKSNFMLTYKSYASLFTNASMRKRTLIAIFIMVFQQWNGVNAILYFMPFLFQDLGMSNTTTSLLASGVGGILMFLATIIAVLWVDRLGRKAILITGALGMASCHFIVAGISGGLNENFTGHSAAGWVCCVFIWIYNIHFGYSWGPCAWIVVSEVFPLGVRSKGISIGAQSNWLNNFGVGMSTMTMVTNIKYGTYIFFGLISVMGAAYVYWFVPETKGRSLEEIDELFQDDNKTSVADRKRMERIYEHLGLLGDSIPVAEKLVHEEVVHVEEI